MTVLLQVGPMLLLTMQMLWFAQAPPSSMAPASMSAESSAAPLLAVTWHIDNFSAFKDILETRKLFSK